MDFDLTKRLREVGTLCGFQILDHVIVAKDGYLSLAEKGWMG
jgi:DNA repair protein RadC